jgi:glucosamine--fructose-6-phosphate aminotransferase (isomerizing)
MATRRPVALAAPSIITLYGTQTDCSGYLGVAISQSGETPEIVEVAGAARASGALVVGITNRRESPLGEAADALIHLDAGEERAVPATKTFTAELAALATLAEAAGSAPWGDDDWDALPGAAGVVLTDDAPATRAAQTIADADRMFVVSRGLMYAVALEAALKIKETTGALAEGYSAADLRHGPIAAVESGVPVIVFAASGPTGSDLQSLVEAVRRKGARVVVCSDEDGADVPLPVGLPEGLMPILGAIRAQQIAYHLALLRGLDPDSPEGLSKVTRTR